MEDKINPPRRRHKVVFVLITVYFWCNYIKHSVNPDGISIIIHDFSVNSSIIMIKNTYL